MHTITKAKKCSIFESKGQLNEAGFSLTGNEDGDVANWKIYQKAYEDFAPLSTAIDATSDHTTQAVSVQSKSGEENDQAVVLIKELMDKTDFPLFLHNVCKNMLIYGNCFVEVAYGEEGVTELKILPTVSMRTNKDMTGKFVKKSEAYFQIGTGGKKIPFREDEIIHFIWNPPNSGTYGRSMIRPLITEINTFISVKNSIKTIVHRYGAPLMHVKIGSIEKDVYPTQADIDGWADDIQDLQANQEFVSGPEVEINTLGFQGKALDLSNILGILRDNYLIGLKVPRDLLGLPEGSNKGQADVTFQAFKIRCATLQRAMKQTVEAEIFERHLSKVWGRREIKEAKKDVDEKILFDVPDLIWEEQESEDEQSRIDTILKLKNNNLLTLKKSIELLPEEFRDEDGMGELEQNVADKKEMEKGKMGNFNNGQPPEEKDKKPFGKESPLKKLVKKKENLFCSHTEADAGRNLEMPKDDRWVTGLIEMEEDYATFLVNILKESMSQIRMLLSKDMIEGIEVEVKEAKDINLDDVNRITMNMFTEMKDGIDIPRNAFETGLNTAGVELALPVTFMLEDYDTLNQINSKNFDLLLTASEEVRGRVKTGIRIGVEKGEGISAIKRRITGIEETYKGRLQTIARTEISHAVNEGRLNGYKQLGVTHVEYLAAGGACPICAPFDGRKMTTNEATGLIPQHSNCRCTYAAFVE